MSIFIATGVGNFYLYFFQGILQPGILIEEIQKNFDQQGQLAEAKMGEQVKQKMEYLKEVIFSGSETK